MRAEKIRELDNTELEKQTQELREQAFRLRFQMEMGQTEAKGDSKRSRPNAHHPARP